MGAAVGQDVGGNVGHGGHVGVGEADALGDSGVGMSVGACGVRVSVGACGVGVSVGTCGVGDGVNPVIHVHMCSGELIQSW